MFWLLLATLLCGIMFVGGKWGIEYYINDRVTPQSAEKDAEWADTLTGITRELKVTDALVDTGAIDMTWLRLHLDMEDITTDLHDGLTSLMDEAIAYLFDDRKWTELTHATAHV